MGVELLPDGVKNKCKEDPDDISAAKRTSSGGTVITNSPFGGRHEMGDGAIGHYPAEAHRRRLNAETGEPEFYGPATDSHVTECHMLLEPEDPSYTADNALETLGRYEKGEVFCCKDSMGAEIEGVVAKRDGAELILSNLHTDREAAMGDPNPELMSAMIEKATSTIEGSSDYPSTPSEFARELARTGDRILQTTDSQEQVFVPTSVPEFGTIQTAHTNLLHPYVGSIAEYIMILNELNWERVPDSAKEAYIQAGADLGIDIFKYLKVPFCAYHSHQGTDKIRDHRGEDMMDPRAAYVRAYLLHTPAARIVENMMANTSHFYGADLEVQDARKVMRYILYSTHGSVQLPENAAEWIASMEYQLKLGKIHSVGRFPESAQHSTCRVRSDKRTIESTSPPQHPDYRMMIGWSLYTKMLDPIAQQALVAAQGDEAKAVAILQNSHPWLFNYQSAMQRADIGQIDFAGNVYSTRSAFEWDRAFNQKGWESHIPGMNMTFADGLREAQRVIVDGVAMEYPNYFGTHGKIVGHLIDSQLAYDPSKQIGLEQWHGIETGVYRPNGMNIGLVTDAKRGMNRSEAATIHADAFRAQTVALTGVRDDADLLEFYGISE